MNSSEVYERSQTPAATQASSDSPSPKGRTSRFGVSRRTLVTGIAWAAPAAVVASPALAVRASMCPDGEAAPDIGFGTIGTTGRNAALSTSTWTMEQYDASGNELSNDAAWRSPGPNWEKTPGFRESIQYNTPAPGPWFGAGTEPLQEVTVRAWKQDGVTLNPGCSYTVSANYATWEGDPFTPEVTVELVHADGETRIHAFELVTRTGGGVGWERENDPVVSEPFSVPSEGPWTPEIRIYFPNALNESANDIYLRSIALNPVV